MFARLFLLFTAMSLMEIFVLIQVGGVLGPWMTVGLVIVTAMVGASLVRSQGLQTAFTVQQRLAQGEMPGQQIVEGLLLVIAGVLLVTPGFITDFLGLLILTPASRAWMANQIMTRAKVHMVQQPGFGGFQAGPGGFESGRQGGFDHTNGPTSPPKSGTTIDGDFERKD